MMNAASPLETEIRRRIAAAGPMPVSEYMALCLGDREHGYYTTRDPLGRRGDFITAPEISQMFGELIGLWMTAVWKQLGAPENIRIIELGPGRGTLMSDALRATQIVPAFSKAIVVHLVEISPALRAQQERTLDGLTTPVLWHGALDEVPQGAAIIIANEFFDALPINQAVKTIRGWHERRIGIDSAGRLAFTIAPDPMPHFETLLPPSARKAQAKSIFEWRDQSVAMEMSRRIVAEGGAALVIDYGHIVSELGETLQAVGQHAYVHPLNSPGNIDLTAHVDFQALMRTAEAMGVHCFGPIEQSKFLRRLGIQARATALKAKASSAAAAEVDLALARLTGTGRTAMGTLFKAAAFAHPSIAVPPGFEA